MTTSYFNTIINNQVIRYLLFYQVKLIHKRLKQISYKWDELLQLPDQLAAYQLFNELKQYFINITFNNEINNNNYNSNIKPPNSINVLNTTLEFIIKYNRLDILQFIINRIPSMNLGFRLKLNHLNGNQLLIAAAINGRLDILHYFDTMKESFKLERADFIAALVESSKSSDINIVKCLEKKVGGLSTVDYHNRQRMAEYAAYAGALDIFMYITQPSIDYFQKQQQQSVNNKLSSPFSMLVVGTAIAKGNLDILKWMHDCGERFSMRWDQSLDLLVMKKSNLDAIKFLFESTESSNMKCGQQTLTYAVRSGNIEIVEYILSKYSLEMRKKSTSPFDIAAEKGYIDIMKLLSHGSVSGSSRAIDYAAATGQLQAIEWIHLNTEYGCSTDAMDGAAASNHSNVVEWLHRNRTEGCSANAMEVVARNNHHEMLKWLHNNRTEQFNDIVAIKEALKSDSLESFQYLHIHRLSNHIKECSIEYFYSTCKFGSIRILEYLYRYLKDNSNNDNSNKYINSNTFRIAAENGKLEIVKFLVERFNSEDCENFGMDSIDNAAYYGHLDVIRYLLEHPSNKDPKTNEKIRNWNNSTFIESTRSDKHRVTLWLLENPSPYYNIQAIVNNDDTIIFDINIIRICHDEPEKAIPKLKKYTFINR